MPETFDGLVSIRDGNATTISLDGASGDARIGGGGQDGILEMAKSNGQVSVSLNGSTGGLQLGGGTATGDLTIFSSFQNIGPTVSISGAAKMAMGGSFFDAELSLRAADSQRAITLDAGGANLWLGGNGRDGDVVLFPAAAQTHSDDAQATIHLDGNAGRAKLRTPGGTDSITLDGRGANVWLGGNGQDGDLVLFAASATDHSDVGQATVHLDGNIGRATLRTTSGQDSVTLDGRNANVWLGGNGQDGDLMLFAASATDHRDDGQATIHLNGDTGDIILRNADCAEEFDIAEGVEALPGMVVVLDDDAALKPCMRPFDKRVAGVISGAGDYRPALVLDRQETGASRQPVALMGKVCVMVCDENGAIAVGDMLTTSAIPGHAMKAGSLSESFGAIIGKALAPHDRGCGLIPMMISLL